MIPTFLLQAISVLLRSLSSYKDLDSVMDKNGCHDPYVLLGPSIPLVSKVFVRLHVFMSDLRRITFGSRNLPFSCRNS